MNKNLTVRVPTMADLTRLLVSLKRRSAHAKEFGHDVLFVKIEDIDALVEAHQRNAELDNDCWIYETLQKICLNAPDLLNLHVKWRQIYSIGMSVRLYPGLENYYNLFHVEVSIIAMALWRVHRILLGL
ncbi:hypothetical protein SME02_001408 [Klebsiella aerogenes]|nr:hypothetical protein [Klebsiella aerogenes]ELY3084426.1 hypothetical protein [Klebsiella aerogenes]